MNIFYNTIRYTGLLCNLLYMLLAIGTMCAASLGLRIAEPNTPEHTYFVETLVLGATICMIVIFGCYGLVCNLLSVNIIFTCFILIVLAVEYLQLHNYQPHRRYSSALQQLEHVWYNVDADSNLLLQHQAQQRCCSFFNNTDDYKYMHLYVPAGCYQSLQNASLGQPQAYLRGCLASLSNSRHYIERRDKLFMWSIVGLELFILTLTTTLIVLLYQVRRRQRRELQLVPPGVRREPRANHVSSRDQLLAA